MMIYRKITIIYTYSNETVPVLPPVDESSVSVYNYKSVGGSVAFAVALVRQHFIGIVFCLYIMYLLLSRLQLKPTCRSP